MTRLSSAIGFGITGVDFQQRIDVARLREERAARARTAMKRHGVAAYLLTRGDNVRYVTGTRGPSFIPLLRYVLAFAEHDPIMYDQGATLEHNRIHCPWIKPENWRLARCSLGGSPGPAATRAEAKKFAAEIKQELKAKGLEKEKLAVDGIEAPSRESLREEGIELVEAMPIMLEARTVKTEDEINCLKMSAALADVGWYRIYEEMKPGVRECDLAAAAMDAVTRAGAENVIVIAAKSGPGTFEDYRGLNRTDRIIQPGDMVYVDVCGVSHLGYLTCYYRTFCVGRKPTDKEKDWYKRVHDWLDAVIDSIKPGATTADAAKHFPPASKWGYKSELHLLCSEIGHGLGLHLYEPPIINRLWSLEHPQTFEKGMVIAVEGREGEPFIGGARIEDMVVVTDTGAEIITRMPRDEIIVAHSFV